MFGKQPVQGELSLDNVRVVRNDLTEADVEVVRATPIAKPAPAAVNNERPEPVAAG